MTEWWRLPAAGVLAVAAVHVAVGVPRPRRYDQCDDTCTTDCGHCKGAGRPDDLEPFDGSDVLERHGVTVQ